jgi:hypothetical protein
MHALRIGISLALAVGLSACAASYRYTLHDPGTGKPQCDVRIDSRRDIAGPAEFRIGKGCTVTVKAAGLVGGQMSAADMIGLLGAAAAIARGQVPAVPAPQPQEFTTEDLTP